MRTCRSNRASGTSNLRVIKHYDKGSLLPSSRRLRYAPLGRISLRHFGSTVKPVAHHRCSMTRDHAGICGNNIEQPGDTRSSASSAVAIVRGRCPADDHEQPPPARAACVSCGPGNFPRVIAGQPNGLLVTTNAVPAARMVSPNPRRLFGKPRIKRRNNHLATGFTAACPAPMRQSGWQCPPCARA